MERDTVLLLRECSAGVKMALGSFDHVEPSVAGEKMKKVLEHYRREHEAIGDTVETLLAKQGGEEKEPEPMATAFSWITTEMKLMLHGDDRQVAKLMMNGCNMGIQSVSGYLHKYPAASAESRETAERLVRTEEEFMKDMELFL